MICSELSKKKKKEEGRRGHSSSSLIDHYISRVSRSVLFPSRAVADLIEFDVRCIEESTAVPMFI